MLNIRGSFCELISNATFSVPLFRFEDNSIMASLVSLIAARASCSSSVRPELENTILPTVTATKKVAAILYHQPLILNPDSGSDTSLTRYFLPGLYETLEHWCIGFQMCCHFSMGKNSLSRLPLPPGWYSLRNKRPITFQF